MSRTALDGAASGTRSNGRAARAASDNTQEEHSSPGSAAKKANGSPASNHGEVGADSSGSAATEEPQDNLESTFGSTSENQFSFGATERLKQQLEAHKEALVALSPPDEGHVQSLPAKSPGGTLIPPPTTSPGEQVSPRSDGGCGEDFTFGTSVPLKLPDLSQVPKQQSSQDPASGSSASEAKGPVGPSPRHPSLPGAGTAAGRGPDRPLSHDRSLSPASRRPRSPTEGSEALALAPVMEHHPAPPAMPPNLPPPTAAPPVLPAGLPFPGAAMPEMLDASALPPMLLPGAYGQPQDQIQVQAMAGQIGVEQALMMGQYQSAFGRGIEGAAYVGDPEAPLCQAYGLANPYGPHFDAPSAPTVAVAADGRWIDMAAEHPARYSGHYAFPVSPKAGGRLSFTTLAAAGCMFAMLVGAAMLTAVFVLRDTR